MIKISNLKIAVFCILEGARMSNLLAGSYICWPYKIPLSIRSFRTWSYKIGFVIHRNDGTFGVSQFKSQLNP